jgi:capsule polysaccharide export protein KpsE/RkpR
MQEGANNPAEASNTSLELARLLWSKRQILVHTAIISLICSVGIAFALPKEYTASATIMPPDQSNSSAMMLAAIAGKASGLSALSGLASGLIGLRSSTDVFVGLLQSGSVTGGIIERFHLRAVYHSRYNEQAAKMLGRHTKISADKKSGLITIAVRDTDPTRARDIVQAYLDQLNQLVNRTGTSQAHQERMFIEHRLDSVGQNLTQAQVALSEFSSQNGTIDIKEQTRALVDAGARVEAELFVEKSGLQSVRQIYGDNNIRVRQSEARIASLEQSLSRVAAGRGDGSNNENSAENALSPPLRALPKLAVPYADLYRRVRTQEAVFQLLTEQYEMARIGEARELPVVNVIDPPGIPERKSWPPRFWLSLALTAFCVVAVAVGIVLRARWDAVQVSDWRKVFLSEIRHAPSKEVSA